MEQLLYYFVMTQSVAKQFHAALTHLLSEEGRGAQTRLASEQQIDRGYLNAIVKQRKLGSDKIRERIADHFKMTFEEMLSLGRRILSGEDISVLKRNKMAEVLSSAPHLDEQTKEISKIDFFPKQELASLSIPDKIIQVIEILNAGSGYDNLMSDFIGAVHDMVSTKKENEALKNQLREIETRLVILEKQTDSEKENMQKLA
ncbi:MAG: hypothetical protein KJ900_17410 [Proteobacteria bacterium]|jgi:ATP-dependent Lon protease|nr:hypothetical protein [Desulfocapsa sp.]MBU3944796.1 hypothetical protein [Pseudomonadota bacterium]MCG2743824.1 hypothetical protein [Desulfobacteraceae bacterium]MBU3984300.1 hypothetical protein [Pseudomonadota bacterium]MBU4044643.1 hypothetical protein [Pseudomonadota bacterium]